MLESGDFLIVDVFADLALELLDGRVRTSLFEFMLHFQANAGKEPEFIVGGGV